MTYDFRKTFHVPCTDEKYKINKYRFYGDESMSCDSLEVSQLRSHLIKLMHTLAVFARPIKKVSSRPRNIGDL